MADLATGICIGMLAVLIPFLLVNRMYMRTMRSYSRDMTNYHDDLVGWNAYLRGEISFEIWRAEFGHRHDEDEDKA